MPVFTDKFVKSVKVSAEGRRLELVDEALSGFVLRVTATGAKTWAVRYKVRRLDQPQQRYTIGPYPAISLAAARERAREILEAAAGGIDLPAREEAEQDAAAAAAKKAAERTVNKIADAYFDDYRRMFRTNSMDSCRNELRYLRSAWGERPIASITVEDAKSLTAMVTLDKPLALGYAAASKSHGLL